MNLFLRGPCEANLWITRSGASAEAIEFNHEVVQDPALIQVRMTHTNSGNGKNSYRLAHHAGSLKTLRTAQSTLSLTLGAQCFWGRVEEHSGRIADGRKNLESVPTRKKRARTRVTEWRQGWRIPFQRRMATGEMASCPTWVADAFGRANLYLTRPDYSTNHRSG